MIVSGSACVRRGVEAGLRVSKSATSGCARGRPARAAASAAPPSAPPARAPQVSSSGVAGLAAKAPGRPRICILGGGFGGLYTALRLEGLMWPSGKRPDITLVDQNDRFVFKPLLYELLNESAAQDDVAPEYQTLLAPYSVRFVQSSVAEVQPRSADLSTASGVPGGTVTLTDGSVVEYDWLVLALGSDTNLELAKGAKEHAIGFSRLADVDRVRKALDAVAAMPAASAPVVSVVGAGYSGVELATVVAERLDARVKVQLIAPSGQIMPGLSQALVESSQSVLNKLGVQIRSARVEEVASAPGADSPVAPACPDVGKVVTMRLAGSGEVVTERSDVVLWTAGSKPSTPGTSHRDVPFPVTEAGMTQTDEMLRVTGKTNVFAIGDASAGVVAGSDAAEAPNTAQVALQQADYVAWNLWASINHRPLLPFRYQHLGVMVALGRATGAVNLNLPLPSGIASAIQQTPGISALARAAGLNLSDTSQGVVVEGAAAALMRRAAYVWRQPTGAQRAKVGTSWLLGGLSELRRAVREVSASSASRPQ